MSIVTRFLVFNNNWGDTIREADFKVFFFERAEGVEEKSGIKIYFAFLFNCGFDFGIVFTKLISNRFNWKDVGLFSFTDNRATNWASK